MLDLMITDAAVLFPDGKVRGGQTVEVKDGIMFIPLAAKTSRKKPERGFRAAESC